MTSECCKKTAEDILKEVTNYCNNQFKPHLFLFLAELRKRFLGEKR